MFHWREKASIPEKKRLVEKQFGKKVPRYLFFGIEETSPLTVKEKTDIETFFGITHSFFSHPERHQKNLGSALNLNTIPENLSSIRVLCIRDGTRMHYSLEIRGQTWHLLQASEEDDKSVNFLDLWTHTVDDQSKRPQESPTELTRIIIHAEEATQIREFPVWEEKAETVVLLDPKLLILEDTEETRFMTLPRRAPPPLFTSLLTKKKGWLERLKELFLG